MQDFLKNILNYYAAFTETRFSSRSTLKYQWTNDVTLTLDVSFFPAFRRFWLDKISSVDARPVDIRPRQYCIPLSVQAFRERLERELHAGHDLNALKSFICQEVEREPRPEPPPEKREIFLDGIRQYNLSLRKAIEGIVKDLQKESLDRLQADFLIRQFPPLSLNLRNLTQEIFRTLQGIAQTARNEDDYFGQLRAYLQGRDYDLVLFDLYYLLAGFRSASDLGSVYLFFDAIGGDPGKEKGEIQAEYPLFFIEITFSSDAGESIQLQVTPLEVKKTALLQAIPTIDDLRTIAGRLGELANLRPTRFLILKNQDYEQARSRFSEDFPVFEEYQRKRKRSWKEHHRDMTAELDRLALRKKETAYNEGFLYRLGREPYDFDALAKARNDLDHLRFKGLIEGIAKKAEKDQAELSLREIGNALEGIRHAGQYAAAAKRVEDFKKTIGLQKLDHAALFTLLDGIQPVVSELEPEMLDALRILKEHYAALFKKASIDFDNLATLFRIGSLLQEEQKLYDLIKLNAKLSGHDGGFIGTDESLRELYRIQQRITEHQNDLRLKNLLQHGGDAERIKTIVAHGRRLSTVYAKLLLSSFAGIIAEPEALFRYFPMEEDLIDILVFDEASRVSIAHSISLILRAKQVVVFGDEYQYGAVGAVTVSRKYAQGYFRKILDSYKAEFRGHTTPEQEERIIAAEADETPEEDQFIPGEISVDAGPEWIRTFGDPAPDGCRNLIVQGDNLQFLKTVYLNQDPLIKDKVKGKGKLFYNDPPFTTKSDFQSKDGATSYSDKIESAEFLENLRERLIFMREALAEDGSIYLHCDWRMNGYFRILLDEVFGKEFMCNDISWCYTRPSKPAKFFPRVHDTIFFFAKMGFKSINHELIRIPYSSEALASSGRGPGMKSAMGDRGLDRLNPKGKIPEDWWTIPILQGNSLEQTGFPTQKPEALLERIIKASSNPGDLVMDCFAGSGTTAAVAEKLGRRWIVCDFGKHAVYTMQKRLLNIADSKVLGQDKSSKKYSLPAKPFAVVSVGAYDFSRVMDLRKNKGTYISFVLALFGIPREEKDFAGKYRLDGIYAEKDGDPVEIFPVWDDDYLYNVRLDEDYLKQILIQSRGRIRGNYYIVVPETCTIVGDMTLKNPSGEPVSFKLLKFPYKILEEVARNFSLEEQPDSPDNINNLVSSVGFYFHDEVKVEAKKTATGLNLTRFYTPIVNREGKTYEGMEGLSLVLIDLNYNGKVFNLHKAVYRKEIREDGHIGLEGVTEKTAVIAIDRHGNESKATLVK